MKFRKWMLLILLPIFLLTGCINVEESDVTIAIKPGVDTVEINTAFVDEGAIAKANNWAVAYEVVENTVDITTVGVYQVIYEVTYKRITKQALRMVTVVDETPPVVTLNSGIDTIIKDSDWVDAGVSVTDNSLGAVTIDTEGVVSAEYIGEYLIKYIVTDASGNLTEIIRYVNVLKTP